MKAKKKLVLPTKRSSVETRKEIAKENKEAAGSKKSIFVSQSAISRFLECRKKAKLTLEGWYPKKSSRALRYGSMYHDALEQVTKFSMESLCPAEDFFVDQAVAKYLKGWEEANQDLVLDQTISKEMLIDSEMVATSIKAYIRNYKSDFDGTKKWVALEHKFEIPYRGIVLFGYIDALYEHKSNLHVFETKTKSRVSPDIVDLLHTDFQTFYYIHGVYLATGKFPKYTVYNVARKYESKMRVDETPREYSERFAKDLTVRPEFYFQRVQTLISEEEYKKWVETNLNPLLDDYKNWREGKAPDYCNTTNCEGKYGSCDFLPICSQENYQNFGRKTKQEAVNAAQRVVGKAKKNP